MYLLNIWIQEKENASLEFHYISSFVGFFCSKHSNDWLVRTSLSTKWRVKPDQRKERRRLWDVSNAFIFKGGSFSVELWWISAEVSAQLSSPGAGEETLTSTGHKAGEQIHHENTQMFQLFFGRFLCTVASPSDLWRSSGTFLIQLLAGRSCWAVESDKQAAALFWWFYYHRSTTGTTKQVNNKLKLPWKQEELRNAHPKKPSAQHHCSLLFFFR